MSEGPVPYIVRQGETLLSIAVGRGLDAEILLNEPKNADLFQVKQRDPDMLAPGDVVYIPPVSPPGQGVALKARNRFKAWAPLVEVRLAFFTEAGPMPGEPYEVDGVGDPRKGPVKGSLDGNGDFVIQLPVGVKHFELRFPKRGIEHTVWVGHLDPKDELSGLRQRLRNLGYLSVRHRDGDPGDFTDAESERLTLMCFQRANGLEATGFPDEATMARIAELSGG